MGTAAFLVDATTEIHVQILQFLDVEALLSLASTNCKFVELLRDVVEQRCKSECFTTFLMSTIAAYRMLASVPRRLHKLQWVQCQGTGASSTLRALKSDTQEYAIDCAHEFLIRSGGHYWFSVLQTPLSGVILAASEEMMSTSQESGESKAGLGFLRSQTCITTGKWTKIRAEGSGPCPRRGHSITCLKDVTCSRRELLKSALSGEDEIRARSDVDASVQARRMIVFGGQSEYLPFNSFNDVYMLDSVTGDLLSHLELLDVPALTWRIPKFRGEAPSARRGFKNQYFGTSLIVASGWSWILFEGVWNISLDKIMIKMYFDWVKKASTSLFAALMSISAGGAMADDDATPDANADTPETAQLAHAPVDAESTAASISSMFYTMENVTADEAINIIEGDHVTTEDLGLESTDLGQMHTPMDLNHLQGFLGRSDHATVAGERPEPATPQRRSPPPPPSPARAQPLLLPHASIDASSQQPEARTPDEVDSKSSIVMESGALPVVSGEPTTPVANVSASTIATNVASSTSAPTATHDAVYLSRKEDKMKQIRAHPIVQSVSDDGRVIKCKCGRSVKLNPAWYILKYEQHLASRNCTFLRQKTKKVCNRNGSLGSAGTAADGHDSTGTGDVSDFRSMDLDDASVSDANASTDVTDAGGPTDVQSDARPEVYELKTMEQVSELYFGSLEALLQFVPEEGMSDATRKQAESLLLLHSNPHFSRITPDGKFVECACSSLVLLSSPWDIGKFQQHVASKTKRKLTALTNVRRKKKLAKPPELLIPHTAHRAARIFPDGKSWDPVVAQRMLPCPGIRDPKLESYVVSAVQVTGGSRPRYKIAQDLFPHVFPPGERIRKIREKLSDAERLLLQDATEAEALWFVDKDGNSVRSLSCKGLVDLSKGEHVCRHCESLRPNATLRTMANATGKKKHAARNPLNRKFCSVRAFTFLEAEFNMDHEYARVLRDLFLIDIPDDSALNMWFDMAEMGIDGAFDSHPALIALIECMSRLKDKERRGVGMQNMNYSEPLDAFTRAVADISLEACEFFQLHLCGRKQKVALARKRKRPLIANTTDVQINTPQHVVSTLDLDASHPEILYDATNAANADTLQHLLEMSHANMAMMPTLSIPDIPDVDLSGFGQPPEADTDATNVTTGNEEGNTSCSERPADMLMDGSTTTGALSHGEDAADDEEDDDEEDDDDDFLADMPPPVPPSSDVVVDVDTMQTATVELVTAATAGTSGASPQPAPQPGAHLEHLPCTGLRDEKVQRYVANAVQTIGGSRPKYVIAKELFPQVFEGAKKVKIVEKLDEHERLILQDAVFSECLWRVDKLGNCVRSLRCHRVGDKRNKGVCRACRDLKAVANFRSVLSRAKSPKNLDNVKYLPTAYSESDPFLRKLSKNASFRALYLMVKNKAEQDPKSATFWLRFARMGLFGSFRSHPVFEGLMESMIEVKDKERRGVGKQNMQYSKALDEFMHAFAALSSEAFELFANQFCGRSIRSQKVKRRRNATTAALAGLEKPATPPRYAATTAAMVASSAAVQLPPDMGDGTVGLEPHALMAPEDLLDENQRLMDRMLDDVRLSVHLQDDDATKQRSDSVSLDPQTYLDEAGVLSSDI
ncbi:TPA: hypothetical protein N0F65_002637 [Lagenidium giganteum]|uniref:F-box domain-containing protein n=1 Tax=Lagenidium giganteum TaxID=4803 RepID=A0AAV2Z2Y5_9STRA|nr:TPA: hypothetical protein N0F65_002637 [Lagenidium giganteum]